jgi:hypothetical protein
MVQGLIIMQGQDFIHAGYCARFGYDRERSNAIYGLPMPLMWWLGVGILGHVSIPSHGAGFHQGRAVVIPFLRIPRLA